MIVYGYECASCGNMIEGEAEDMADHVIADHSDEVMGKTKDDVVHWIHVNMDIESWEDKT